MHSDIKFILISEEEIARRCRELADVINHDYVGRQPVLVGLLKGSVPFMAELMKRITLNIEIDFMDVKSYVGTESCGDVQIIKDLLLYQKGARDVKIISLLDKPDRRVCDIKADYVGFEVPDAFVVGFGLDFNQKYRNLPYIGVLKDECY